jgi:SAM-dependent methyltransferase
VSGRALSFGSVAESYERYRPGYPDEVVDVVLGYAGRRVATALEIGAGTGKATRAFAARGIVVTATEPDPEMLAELRGHVPGSVVTVQSAFEALPAGGAYDLVLAAAALHWTEPEGRWERVAGMLAPGGVCASFGGPIDLADPEVDARVRDARASIIADDDVSSPDGTPADSPMQWPGTELARSHLFDDVRQVVLERRMTLAARDYVGLLSTVSAYLELSAADRETVLRRILEVVPDRVDVVGDITLHLARLAGDA